MTLKPKKSILSITIILTAILILSFSISFANPSMGDNWRESVNEAAGRTVIEEPEKTTYVERSLARVFNSLHKSLDKVTKEELHIQNLVFNPESLYGSLSIMTSRPIGMFFREYFYRMLYLFAPLLLPLGLWTAYQFFRVDDKPERQKELKEKLIRYGVTIILFTSIPLIIEIIVGINSSLVNTFASWTGDGSTQLNLDSEMEEIFTNQGLLFGSFLTFIYAGIKMWIAVYYLIRDISIGFLFVIFPLIAIFYPLDKEKTYTWFKEMCSNIFTQSIHALFFSLYIGMGQSFLQNENSGIAEALYLIIALALVMVFTSTVKGLLKMEGNVGGAKSSAGIGMAMGALALMKTVGRTGNSITSNVTAGNELVKEGKTEQYELQKGLSTNDAQTPNRSLGYYRSAGKSYEQNTNQNIAKAKITQGRKMQAKAAGKLAGAMAGGLAGAGIGLGMTGSLRGSAAIGAVGIGTGQAIGGAATAGATESYMHAEDLANYNNEVAFMQKYEESEVGDFIKDGSEIRNYNPATDTDKNFRRYAKREQALPRDVAEAKLWGIHSNYHMNNENVRPEVKEQINALRAYRGHMARGDITGANLQYAKLTPTKIPSPSELKGMDNIKLHQEKNMSMMYTVDDNGAIKDILSFGKGDNSLNPLEMRTSDVSYSTPDVSISYEKQMDMLNESELYAARINSDINSEAYKIAKNEMHSKLKSQEIARINELRGQFGGNLNIQNSGTTRLPQDIIDNDLHELKRLRETIIKDSKFKYSNKELKEYVGDL